MASVSTGLPGKSWRPEAWIQNSALCDLEQVPFSPPKLSSFCVPATVEGVTSPGAVSIMRELLNQNPVFRFHVCL